MGEDTVTPPIPWMRRARDVLDEVVLYRSTPPEEEVRIAETARRQTLRLVKPLILVACTVGLLWWPFDLLLYSPDVVRVFAFWRAIVLVYCVAYYATCERWSFARRYPALYATAAGAAVTFVVAASLGTLGTLLKPWFASLLLTPVMSFPFLVTPRVRLAGTSVVAAAALLGFFGFSNADRGPADVGTATGLMAFSVAVSTFAGHAIYHLFRISVLQAESLARRSEELEMLSSRLTETVEARTAELRALTAYVESLRETERATIARDLHDELGQLLTGMRMELDMAERARSRGDDLQPRHQNLVRLLDATLASTRSILAHLRPRILDDFGLVPALDWLVTDAHTRSGLEIQFSADPEDLDVRGDTATSVFRILQESLTNALRHSGARTIHMRIRREPGELLGSVTDDGIGLPPPSARRPFSGGLLGMRERAASLGGTLDIAAPPEGGTRVSVRLPFSPEAS
jgi:signal transduction histidine kinase